MLDSMANEDSGHEDSYNSNGGNIETKSFSDSQTENPFDNGGPIPPEKQEKAVLKSDSDIGNEINSNLIDERLKINIPQMNIVDNQVVPTVEVPVSETGYSENPDLPSDGWSNMDPPPEDDYYPDDDQLAEEASQLEQSFNSNNSFYNNEQQFSGEFVSAKQVIGKNTTDNAFIKIADGSQLSSDDFKAKVISEFGLKDSFAAPILEKTDVWKCSDNSIETNVSNAYDLELIKKKIPAVSDFISNLCGRKIYFNVTLQEITDSSPSKPKALPSQVNMLLDVFKGTLVAGKS